MCLLYCSTYLKRFRCKANITGSFLTLMRFCGKKIVFHRLRIILFLWKAKEKLPEPLDSCSNCRTWTCCRCTASRYWRSTSDSGLSMCFGQRQLAGQRNPRPCWRLSRSSSSASLTSRFPGKSRAPRLAPAGATRHLHRCHLVSLQLWCFDFFQLKRKFIIIYFIFLNVSYVESNLPNIISLMWLIRKLRNSWASCCM